jgi:ADP-heptose:LPS heptosyltransferase
MKILVVSLLRIGDLLMAAPTLKGLKAKFPGADMDVLINRSSLGARTVLSTVRTFHVFERDQLQAELTDADQPLFQPFYRLEKMVRELQREDYDLVINLTHNRLSGWLCGMVGRQEVLGLSLDTLGRPKFGSSWFQYLNDRAEARGKEIFHFADVFWFGSGLGKGSRRAGFQRSTFGQTEAQALLGGIDKFALVQAFSSEEKKEWAPECWHHTLQIIQGQHPELTTLILGAPSEAQRVAQLVTDLEAKGVRARAAVCSLPGAVALLDRAEILLTVDTSIKHLAADTTCPVIELSLGSSDWRRTGVCKSGCLILQPKVDCAPCAHSVPCHQPSHYCGQGLAPDTVAAAAHFTMTNDTDGLSQLARRQMHRLDIFRTHITAADYWQVSQVGRRLEATDLREWIDKLTTKLILQGTHLESLAPYGSEALRLGQWLRSEFPEMPPELWDRLLKSVDQETKTHHADALDAGVRLAALVKASRSQPMVELKEMRNLQVKIEDAERRLEVRRRLMRSLRESVEAAL